MKTKLTAFIFLMTLQFCAFAQKPFFSSANIETFVPLTGGTVLNTISTEDDETEIVNLPFTFIFNNTSYNSLHVCTNGLVSFTGGLGGITWINGLSSEDYIANQDLIAPWWDDLIPANYAFNNSQEGICSYKVSGNAPNRKITIEWNKYYNFRTILNADPDPNPQDQKVTFQLELFETTNGIKFNYKRSAYINTTMTASVGFKFIDNTFLAMNYGNSSSVLSTSARIYDTIDQADFSDYTDDLSLYFGPPIFRNPGPISLCLEGSYYLNPNTTNGTWASSNPSIATVNADGYITGLAAGTSVISLTNEGGTVSATVTVGATPTLPITDGKPAYKFNGNPQGPLGGGATLNYVGYDGYNYYGQTQPSSVGFYKANIQVNNQGGCPYRFYIFSCPNCSN